MSKLIQVLFLKSPCGSPWKMGYRKGDVGFVRIEKARKMEKAGVIAPVDLPLSDASSYVPTKDLDGGIQVEAEADFNTIAGVKAQFGTDIEAMKEYCENNGIKYHAATKRPETFWKKIAKA